jgi:penicillin V acylase-like amidase (Ntn superfamily)
MNEAGLVVLSLGLDGTQFPKPDDRLAIDENGWIQYQLDNSATLADVVESIKHLRLSSRSIGDSHFFLCDKSGACMVIEYVGEQSRVYTGGDLPYPILANDTYQNLMNYLTSQKNLPREKREPYRVASSCCRFLRVLEKIDHFDPATDSVWTTGSTS